MGFFSGLVGGLFGGSSKSTTTTTSTNEVTVNPTTNVQTDVIIDLDQLAQAIAQGNANDIAIHNASTNLMKESQSYLNSFNSSLLDMQIQGIDVQKQDIDIKKQGLNAQNKSLIYQQQKDAELLELQQYELFLKNEEITSNKQFLEEISSYVPLAVIGAGAYFLFKKGKKLK